MSAQHALDKRIRTQSDEYYRLGAEQAWKYTAQQVDVHFDLSYHDFVREYVRKKRPVVIKGGAAKDAITPETLKTFSGNTPLAELVGGGGSPYLVRGSASSIEKFKSLITLGDYLNRFTEDSDLPYLTNLSVSNNFPKLANAFAPPRYFEPNWNSRWPFGALDFEKSNRGGAEVFISPAGGTYGVLHYDRHHLFLGVCQYFGKKLWWMCPPEQSEYLYPVGGRHQSISWVNPASPDLQRFPLFAMVKPFVVTLEAGDLMFVPSSWWHMTRAVSANISGLHRILNWHNIRGYMWDFRHYLMRNPALLLMGLKQVVSRK